jgi:RNA polymerase sigma-70 factor, ECF subfamily
LYRTKKEGGVLEPITDGKALFHAYFKDVFRACNYMVQNTHDAEDLCQEVFSKALSEDFKVIQNQKSWLLSISMNMSRNYLKKRKRILLKDTLTNHSFTSLTNNQNFEQIESQNDLVELMNKLPVGIRKVMVLKYVHECKDKEIADILKIPEGTVKSRHFKGKKLLKKYIQADQSYLLKWRDSLE